MCASYRLLARRLLLAAMLLCGPASVSAEEHTQAEYQVKAAFLYNFARFTSWPEHTNSTFNLCILGDDPFSEALDALTGKTVHNETLTVTRLDHPSALDGCELVYISASYSDELNEIIALLQEQAILTVSDIDAFIDHGGIIGFRIIDNKIRFEINTSAAARAGLAISSKLLSLASRVSMER
ncbi:MAG: YfiR family protein [Gammaproteobacteria bacterium]|nr:YfiR family protein [Gammaproteobacteria bacterium]